MKYNFDIPLERRGSGSMKWDEAPGDVLPLWVADMDFRTAPCIVEALLQRVEHGAFGYTLVGDNYYDALCRWFERRHQWKINPSSVIYTSGVVPAISAIFRGMLKPGNGVIVQTPAYNCFFSSIRNLGGKLYEAPLLYHPDGYTIDFKVFEEIAKRPDVTMFILCNPHNPVGRVWTADELRRLGDICMKHGVFVIADEIHCELTFDRHRYIPYQSLGEEYAQKSVACLSPSKAFNTAGLQIANIVCPDPEVKKMVDRGINDNEVCDVNPFGVVGLIAAYNRGEEWLEELKKYIWGNYLCVCEFFKDKLSQYSIVPLQGTYLVWINCEVTGMKSDILAQILKNEYKVWLSPGTIYGKGGENFLRLNLACPRSRLQEALNRMKLLLEKFK